MLSNLRTTELDAAAMPAAQSLASRLLHIFAALAFGAIRVFSVRRNPCSLVVLSILRC